MADNVPRKPTSWADAFALKDSPVLNDMIRARLVEIVFMDTSANVIRAIELLQQMGGSSALGGLSEISDEQLPELLSYVETRLRATAASGGPVVTENGAGEASDA